MRQSFKEKANQVLSRAGQKMPTERICVGWWGEVELPDCLRAELEDTDSVKED